MVKDVIRVKLINYYWLFLVFVVFNYIFMSKFIFKFLFGVLGDWWLEFILELDFEFDLEFVLEVLLYCFEGGGCCKFIEGCCKGVWDCCKFKNDCLCGCEMLFCVDCCCLFICEWIDGVFFWFLLNFRFKFFVLIEVCLGWVCIVDCVILYLFVVKFGLVVWVVKFECKERVIFVNNWVGFKVLGIILGIFKEDGNDNLGVEGVCLLLICGIVWLIDVFVLDIGYGKGLLFILLLNFVWL